MLWWGVKLIKSKANLGSSIETPVSNSIRRSFKYFRTIFYLSLDTWYFDLITSQVISKNPSFVNKCSSPYQVLLHLFLLISSWISLALLNNCWSKFLKSIFATFVISGFYKGYLDKILISDSTASAFAFIWSSIDFSSCFNCSCLQWKYCIFLFNSGHFLMHKKLEDCAQITTRQV